MLDVFYPAPLLETHADLLLEYGPHYAINVSWVEVSTSAWWRSSICINNGNHISLLIYNGM
jgi:hypothetical protein